MGEEPKYIQPVEPRVLFAGTIPAGKQFPLYTVSFFDEHDELTSRRVFITYPQTAEDDGKRHYLLLESAPFGPYSPPAPKIFHDVETAKRNAFNAAEQFATKESTSRGMCLEKRLAPEADLSDQDSD